MFYNTTNIEGTSLTNSHKKTATQNEFIKELFNTHKILSPSDVFTIAEEDGRRILIGSVRRAISDLTAEGVLMKLDKRVESMYGSQEYLWRAA